MDRVWSDVVDHRSWLERPTMAEAGETLRTGGTSSSGTRSPPARPESDTVKAEPEDRMDAFGEAAT